MQESSALLFVYGTLMRGHSNPWSRRLWDAAGFLGPASAPGRLYRLGSYPGLVQPAAGGQLVHGELANLRSAAAIFPQLDHYEGPAYRRVQCDVQLTLTGAVHSAWLYLYLGPVRDEDHIPSGMFSSHP